MYTREVKGKELELGVSGKLYKDALVMYDRETGTLWTQVDGSALRGPLEGSRLAGVPAMQTTWKVWKHLHPDTLVLAKPAGIHRSPYAEYFTDPERRGLFGTRGDKRMGGKEMIVGVELGGDAVAVPIAALESKQVAEIEVGGEPVVIFYATEDGTPAVYRATVDRRRLTFRVVKRNGRTLVEDIATRSLWELLEGRAVAGPLQGRQLERVAYLHSYWYAWSAYRPHTRLVE